MLMQGSCKRFFGNEVGGGSEFKLWDIMVGG